MRRFAILPLFALALVFAAGTANATPVVYTVDAGASNLSADVSGTFSFTINTNLGSFNGAGNASGSLASNTETGTATVEWGVPAGGPTASDPPGGWFDNISIDSGDLDLNTGDVGTVGGGATIDLTVIDINFDLAIDVTNIQLGIGTPSFSADALPSVGGEAGPGPWTAIDLENQLLIGADIDIAASGPLGINFNFATNVSPTAVGNFPLITTLERTGVSGAAPRGTGSQASVPIPGLSLSLPAGSPTNFSVDQSLGGVISIDSVTLTLTSLNFTNITGNLVATSNAIIPEPATVAMIGIGLVGLGIVGRRRG